MGRRFFIMKKRVFTAILLLLALTIGFAVQTFAEDSATPSTIAFTTDGVTSGYTKHVDNTSVKCTYTTKNGKEKEHIISEVYVVTQTAEKQISLKNESTLAVSKTVGFFLQGQHSSAWNINATRSITEDDFGTGFEVTPDQLTAAGFKDKDFEAGHLKYYFWAWVATVKVGGEKKTVNFGILIQSDASTTSVKKDELLSRLQAVPTTGYYTTNDHYNGQ